MKNELLTERRARFLENLLQEAIVNILAEQDAAPAPEAPAPAPSAAAEPAPAPPASALPPTPPAEAGTPEKKEELTVDDMIERLNVIRGGRSFKDNDVYAKLVLFFGKLTEEQKAALQSQLIDIGQAVINVPEGEQSNAPAAAPAPAPETSAPEAPVA
jgi:hypothetical protein